MRLKALCLLAKELLTFQKYINLLLYKIGIRSDTNRCQWFVESSRCLWMAFNIYERGPFIEPYARLVNQGPPIKITFLLACPILLLWFFNFHMKIGTNVSGEICLNRNYAPRTAGAWARLFRYCFLFHQFIDAHQIGWAQVWRAPRPVEKSHE